MTEERFRLVKSVLLSAFLLGVLWISRAALDTYREHAENGRFRPSESSQDINRTIFDTRTGETKRGAFR